MIQFPDTYLVLDLETVTMEDGRVDPRTDRILEIGLALVEDGVLTSSSAFLINPGMKVPQWTTKFLGITAEMVADLPDNGGTINAVLKQIAEFRSWIVGFNILFYDLVVLEHEGRRYRAQKHPLLHDARIDPGRLFDVGALYKGYRMLKNFHPGAMATEGEGTLEYMKRILGTRSRGAWNLAQAATEFDLQTADINRHRAKGDCILTHRLLEHMKRMPRVKR